MVSVDQSWAERFSARYKRRPRVLHIGNIAGYAWTNAQLMRRRGIDAVVLDPDFYHIASAPEWLEATIEGPVGDPFYPDWAGARPRGFRRPEWYINGPTPFVLRELAARETGQAGRRALYRGLSALYRKGLAAKDDTPSRFRSMMESPDGLPKRLKSMAKRLTLGGGTAPVPVHAPVPMPAADAADLAPSAEVSPLLPTSVPVALAQAALGKFDVIIGYALGARFAVAAECERFASLELGTLRGLVFEESPLGRLAAQVYRASPGVFVTNVDCLDAAHRLGLAPDRLVALPHPFDVEAAASLRGTRPQRAASGRPSFFCPARHHWRQGNASWLKGNDVLIRGATEAMRRGGDFELVFVEWGEDLAESRALIAELGLADRVRFVPTLPRQALWPQLLGSVGVLDQFAASAFGGAALEAMALGVRVISRLDQTDLRPFFDTPPPILHAATPEAVADRIGEVLADPDDHAGAGMAGAAWMDSEHGVDRQLALQFGLFDRLLETHGPAQG